MRHTLMNEHKWLFIGTDKRLPICSEMMAERGYTSLAIETNSFTPALQEALIDFKPNHIVFPILEMTGTIPIELLNEATKLYTGIVSEAWLRPFQKAHLMTHSYLQEEQFIWKNAQLTAEAFISVYYSRMGRTVSNKRFYVAGYGRVGKVVADVLASLGGEITILARSDAQLGEAQSRGFSTKRLTSDCNLTNGCLINTIPAKWLSLTPTSELFIFDLASAPGCLTVGHTPEYYTLLPGLPGTYFPVDAAAALADALERIHRR